MSTSVKLLDRYRKRWQFLLGLDMMLYAIGPAILTFLLGFNLLWCFLVLLVLIIIYTLTRKPWQLSLEAVSSYLDRELDELDYSSGLLLVQSDALPALARLQQQRAQTQLEQKIKSVKPRVNLSKAVLSAVFCIILGLLVHFSPWFASAQISDKENFNTPVVFTPVDTVVDKIEAPKIISQQVTVYAPAYTGIPPRSDSKMNLEILEGSRLSWKLKLDRKADSVQLIWKNRKELMSARQHTYQSSKIPESSGFYNFRLRDTSGASFTSDLYSVTLTNDQAPVVEINGLESYSSFDYSDQKTLAFNVYIADDYGIGKTFINATVTSGSGESVKFREKRISFDQNILGKKEFRNPKMINLDSLKMQPGDELYFHIETRDLKEPMPNISRSETYFAKIEDTVSYSYAVEGTLGVDQMPDYFRSQRQLIIDTEKLIKEQPRLSEDEFQSRSNALGAEQQALRMKYGKFMGEESEGGEEHDHHHDHGHEGENPIADYMHNHDGSNEHNLVEEDAEQAQRDTTSTGNASTFERSLHGKMRIALAQMWDSELNLRTGKPQESLPYQHRALELLQEIKNAARIYVHRIGFDPPPIKEDTRLSGNTEEVDHYLKQEERNNIAEMAAMRESVERLEEILTKPRKLNTKDRKLLQQAGEELAEKALERPGNHLHSLRDLKTLAESNNQPDSLFLRRVQSALFNALDHPEYSPGKTEARLTKLQMLMRNEINTYE